MPESVKANRFNVSRIVYAMVTKDDATAFEHGPIKKFADPMQVQFTPRLASGTLYGGGILTEDLSMLTGAELQVDVNKVPIEVRSEIYGHEYKSGVLHEKAPDQPKDIAIGYEIESTGSNRELVWLHKGKPRPMAETVQQKTENLPFSTHTLSIGFVPRVFDKEIRAFGDTANPDFTKEMAEAFLSTIPNGTLVAGA